jgi:hypothetical protein
VLREGGVLCVLSRMTPRTACATCPFPDVHHMPALLQRRPATCLRC